MLAVVAAILIVSCGDAKRERIRKAVENQLGAYPESTLQDLYKNFFQDYFGPGHIVGDTLAPSVTCGRYYFSELSVIFVP
jgi:hypothetical protein